MPRGQDSLNQCGPVRLRAAMQNLLEGGMPATDMVEDSVEEDAQAPRVRGLDQGVEIGIVAETRVDPEGIDRVVAVGRGREDRPERQPRGAEFDRVVEPGMQLGQAMHDGRAGNGLGLGADEAERKDLPPDSVLDPGWHQTSVHLKLRMNFTPPSKLQRRSRSLRPSAPGRGVRPCVGPPRP